ncbi:nucleotidyltransferase domain-containing protein [Candidatus Pacearchaeota archaeon]|nr:nucleotidyltransferase domain-containing protein [Candidatus Pacearchaeota archaeon]
MGIKLLKNIDFSMKKNEFDILKSETKLFLSLLKKSIKKQKIKADVFVGGSFAKNTMMEGKEYDIDIFVRFDKKYADKSISLFLERVIKNLKIKYQKVHGSRDYIQIQKNRKIAFEIIPVIKIKKANEARNTTDLSYFHVNYVKKRLNDKLRKEISITKKFFKAQKVYGAESYISGFSGYAIECLIIHYKTFENMIRAFSKASGRPGKDNEKIIIDPERQYKKQEIMIEMNESKTHSPIVLVDPTWKERNVLAALSLETFDKTKEAINSFLKHPNISYFEVKAININNLKQLAKKNDSEFLHINIKTDRQERDIAGTKLRKFSKFIIGELEKYFIITKDEFDYKLKRNADLYLILKSRKEIIKQGPPLTMKENVAAFKKANNNTFTKNGKIYSRMKINFTAKDFIKKYKKDNQEKLNEMDIINLEVD